MAGRMNAAIRHRPFVLCMGADLEGTAGQAAAQLWAGPQEASPLAADRWVAAAVAAGRVQAANQLFRSRPPWLPLWQA